jgi:CubicO group peptidase (beta-lactamase class C family)
MKNFLLLLALMFLDHGAFSQVLTERQIDSLVNKTLTTFDVPGIAVAVVKDEKVVLSKGYGVRSLLTKEKVDENTLFGIASNSKAFTTTALALLIDEGKLKWDDKVRNYIPEFMLYNPYVTEEFTIRDLLTHRSGLGLGAGDLMLFPDSSDFTLKDIIHNLRYLKPVSSFRSKYDYDNNLYIVAGEVIARITGKSWDEFVEERILKPLGMTRSAACFERIPQKSNYIDGHAPVDGKVKVIARSTLKLGHSAGGIYSSVNDLGKWLLMHLANGKYGENKAKQLVSAENLAELVSAQTILQVRSPGYYNTHFAAYGLGFLLNDIKGYKQVSHTGGLEGMVTQITMIPEINLGIIVLTNQQDGAAFQSITNTIKDGYLNCANRDWVSFYAKNKAQGQAEDQKMRDEIWKEIAKVQKEKAGKADYSAYIGTYHDLWFGDVVISVKNGKLWFDSKRSPKLTGEMFAYKGNTFVVKWRDRSMDADAYVNFSLNTEGLGAGITMKPISPLTDFSYDFQDLDLKRVF